MTPADKLAAAEIRRKFAREVMQSEDRIDLARAALLLAAEEEPLRCDVERCLESLEKMGAQANERVRFSRGGQVEALNGFLFEEMGFVGNEQSYYDPRNSMLHHVIQRRTGIPITLSVIYMAVGTRAGLSVSGVGLPGHFIVRASANDGESSLVDPFNGRVVDIDECQDRLDEIYGGQVALTDEHLKPVSILAILARMLSNLKAIYLQAGLHQRALAAVDRILLVSPGSVDDRRDRGMILAQLNRLPEAIGETRSYLNLSPHAPDRDAVSEQLKKMQMRQAMQN